jgi:hypothetical protein
VNSKTSGFGTRFKAYLAILIGAIVLSWLAFKVISGVIHTIVIVAIVLAALYALNWGLGARRGDA